MIPSDGVDDGDNLKRVSENEQCIRVDHDPRDSICVHDKKNSLGPRRRVRGWPQE